MSDPTQPVVNEPVVDAAPDNTPEPTIDDRAREMGWRPLEEYEGDPEKWVSAQSFVDRKPLFDKIDSQNKRVKALEKSLQDHNATLKELAEHHKKVAETSYKKAMADLKAERRAAVRAGDHELVEAIEDQIDNLKPEEVPEIKTPEPQPYTQEINEWMSENSWYNSNKEMQHVADGFGKAAQARGLSTPEILAEMKTRIKEAYPDFFRNPNKDKAPPSKTKDHTATAHKAAAYRPSAQQQRFAKTFVEQGVFKTVDDYYKQLREIGEL